MALEKVAIDSESLKKKLSEINARLKDKNKGESPFLCNFSAMTERQKKDGD